MSETTLTSLLDFLFGMLSPKDMRRVAEQLIEHADEEELKPYTIEELHERIAQSERDFAEGDFYTHEEVMKMLDEELELTPRYAEAV